MDFGRILDEWEKRKADGANSSKRLEELIDRYAPTDDALDDGDEYEGPSEPIPARQLPIESEIDLHGLTVSEAQRRVDHFLRESLTRGLKKVLIIHGKGKHSTEGGKLKSAVLRYLEQHPLAGATGEPNRKLGGSGAVWVRVRQRSR